jgi:hypothetical protein
MAINVTSSGVTLDLFCRRRQRFGDKFAGTIVIVAD